MCLIYHKLGMSGKTRFEQIVHFVSIALAATSYLPLKNYVINDFFKLASLCCFAF